VTYNVFTAVPL